MPSVKKCETEWPADTNQVGGDFCWQPATFYHSVGVLLHSPICHLHTSYIEPYLPPKILHSLYFSFLLGINSRPKRTSRQRLCQIFFFLGGGEGGGTNKVHYGRCASGILILTSGQLTAKCFTVMVEN